MNSKYFINFYNFLSEFTKSYHNIILNTSYSKVEK